MPPMILIRAIAALSMGLVRVADSSAFHRSGTGCQRTVLFGAQMNIRNTSIDGIEIRLLISFTVGLSLASFAPAVCDSAAASSETEGRVR